MKVIFLDFDGVMNTLMTAGASVADWGSVEWLARQLERPLVERLNRITDATGAVIVLSTAWRDRHPLNQLRMLLRSVGVKAPVIGSTPKAYQYGNPAPMPRDAEIALWLEWTGVIDFVVLDDIAMERDGVRERSILCDPVDGLTDADARRAIEILRRGNA